MAIDKLDFTNKYRKWVSNQKDARGSLGVTHAIGGEFEAFGIIQREMLIYFGLKATDYIVDVGCGSGRLSSKLVDFAELRYLGIDVVPDLLEHAKAVSKRRDWSFKVASGLSIPERDAKADLVCFFSVFTHLLHEQSFIYLQDAARVTKPGGKIVISFLEFEMDFHWEVFAATIANEQTGGDHPLNSFIERVALRKWASHLGLEISEIHSGDEAFVPLPHPLTLDSGARMERLGNLGQSICVMTKPLG